MVRYGILGFGNHGVKRLAPAFADAKSSILAGIWRRDMEKAHANGREFGIQHIFRSAEEMCASQAIDAVFVCSPDALHMPDALLAFAHGKPVLCEKPAAMNASQLERMLAGAREANVLFGVAQNFRYNPSVNLIREWFQKGRVGQPILATAHFCFNAGHSPRQWIYDPSLACGGAIGDVGIHCIDALRYALGDDISAITTVVRKDREAGGLESGAALAMEFSRGTLGSIMVSFRAKYRTWMEIVGEDGVIHCDDCFSVDDPVQVILRQKGEIVDAQQVTNNAAYSHMLDAFSAAIEGMGAYAAPGADAIHNQLALDAAYASMRSGCTEAVKAR
jgi:1,5-anhydro-D-fructose reductase (1,5-anhydro-D-mannitol-forming)